MVYNQAGIECSYIQNLLRNTYIPTIPYYKEDILTNTTLQEKLPYNSQFIVGDNIYIKNDTNSITYLRTIKDNEHIIGVTDNYFTSTNYYDSKTHEILGDYLRYYCYKNNVHLMSLYNCFSDRYINDASLPIYVDSKQHVHLPEAKSKSIIAIKVKFGKSYDIRINPTNLAYSQLVLFDGVRLLETHVDQTTTNSLVFDSTYKLINVGHNNKNIYTVPNASNFVTTTNPTLKNEQLINILNLEKYLYLFIEIDTLIITTSVTVIEQEDAIYNLDNSLIKNYLNYKPYSDKLLSYILDISISPATNTRKNIESIQEYLQNTGIKLSDGSTRTLPPTYIPGEFDLTTETFIYNTFRSSNISDFIGYIDKDVEELIYKGVNYGID